MKWTVRLGAGCLLAFAALTAGSARAATVTLNPVKDSSIFESDTGSLADGSGSLVYAGVTGQNDGVLRRRALFAFDVAHSIPTGASVTAVSFRIQVARSGASGASQFTLNALTADWGEGASASVGGQGDAAQANDATWLHRFYATSLWANPGGDFADVPSDTETIGGPGGYVFGGPGLVADVQRDLDAPATNFGWILIGDEGGIQNAKQIASRENATAANRPSLTVTYSVPEPTGPLAALVLGVTALARRRRRAQR